MIVEKGKEISIEYTLRVEDDVMVDSNVDADPLIFIQGAQQMVPGLEDALEGMAIGETRECSVSAEKGFGERSETAFQEVEKRLVPEAAWKVGTHLQASDADGDIMNVCVVEVKDETVVMDLNHPLAGKTLHFNVKVLDIKEPGA